MHFCTSFTLIQIMSNFVELLFVYIFWEITTENFRYSSQKQSKYFLFFPKDKKHSKTFPPLFRSNYVGSWCNLNSPFLQSIRVDLKKVSDKMPPWLITDLIFFTFQNEVNTKHTKNKIPWKWTFFSSNFSFCWPFSQPKSSHTVDWSSRHPDLLCGGKKRVNGFFLGLYCHYSVSSIKYALFHKVWKSQKYLIWMWWDFLDDLLTLWYTRSPNKCWTGI